MSVQVACSLRRLRVIAEADPSALARVVERFQHLNIIPRRIVAEVATNDCVHIQVDVFGISDAHQALILGKILQAPIVTSAYWQAL